MLKTEPVLLTKILRMRLLFLLFCFAFSASLSGQYYFNDILANKDANTRFQLLRKYRITRITAQSFEADNTPTEGFSLTEDIALDGKRSTLQTSDISGQHSETKRQYELNRIRRSQSYSHGIENDVQYQYSSEGKLQLIRFVTTDTALKTTEVEVHDWHYDAKGQPEFAWIIKNNTDSIYLKLVRDTSDQVVEEHWMRKKLETGAYYYYYDTAGRVTDIVRYNNRLKKLIPDFLYEYDTAGRVSGMTQVFMSNSSYIVWKYTYNPKGLKQEESGYDKQKKFLGKMVYTYE